MTDIATDELLGSANELVTLVNPEGNYHENAKYPLDLKDADLQSLYRMMVLTRRLDQEAITLQRQGQLAAYASSLGQEAAQVGSAYALRDNDWIFPSYREKGMELVRGIPAWEKLAIERGSWFSGYDPYRFRMGLTCLPVATQTLHAVGFAMGARLEQNPIVVLACVGDGATSEGDWHEAMNFAGVYQAPCVFFIQNNQWAISVPLAGQTKAPTLAHKAVGYGMPGYRCDGNDVLATYAVTKTAVERARSGDGPAMIEALTYRMEAHTTSDDPTRYRNEADLQHAAASDPITRMEKFLRGRDLLGDEFARDLQEEREALAARLRRELLDAPPGDPLEIFDHIYVDPPRTIQRQRAELQQRLAAEDEIQGGGR